MSLDWKELLTHPAWARIEELQKTRRADLINQLISLAVDSPDAKVARIARHIYAIDEFIALPGEERDLAQTMGDAYDRMERTGR